MTHHGPEPSIPAHPSHDRLLIAASAAGDLAGRELERAAALLGACAECRALHDDLRAIASTTRHLPAAPSPAGLDLRVSPERAASLARGGLWRRFLRPFGRSGSGAIRPLAATFTTLGVAGLLLAALPTLQFGSGAASQPTASSAYETRAGANATDAREAFPPGAESSTLPAVGGADGAPEGTPGTEIKSSAAPGNVQDQAVGGDVQTDEGSSIGRDEAAGVGGPGGPPPIVVVSVGFLGAGLGLFVLRRAAFRLR